MKYAPVVRAVRLLLDRESAYRNDDAAIVAIIGTVLADEPDLCRGALVFRTAGIAMGVRDGDAPAVRTYVADYDVLRDLVVRR